MAFSGRAIRGKALAKRVCSKIVRNGLANMLEARYDPERKVIRIGVPTRRGAMDCAIDYPADGEHVDGLLERLQAYAAGHRQELASAVRGAQRLRKAA
jgi:hypothetical protein